jgi:hypothetical protein
LSLESAIASIHQEVKAGERGLTERDGPIAHEA